VVVERLNTEGRARSAACAPNSPPAMCAQERAIGKDGYLAIGALHYATPEADLCVVDEALRTNELRARLPLYARWRTPFSRTHESTGQAAVEARPQRGVQTTVMSSISTESARAPRAPRAVRFSLSEPPVRRLRRSRTSAIASNAISTMAPQPLAMPAMVLKLLLLLSATVGAHVGPAKGEPEHTHAHTPKGAERSHAAPASPERWQKASVVHVPAAQAGKRQGTSKFKMMHVNRNFQLQLGHLSIVRERQFTA